jgi:hypothetical protein
MRVYQWVPTDRAPSAADVAVSARSRDGSVTDRGRMVAVRRIVLIALTVSLPVAIAVFVPVWRYGVVKGPGVVSNPELHPPDSRTEREAAAAGFLYVRALKRGDVAMACRLAASEAATLLHCDARPRIPRVLRQRAAPAEAIDAAAHRAKARIAVAAGSKDGINFLRLSRWKGAWRVVEHHRGAYI